MMMVLSHTLRVVVRSTSTLAPRLYPATKAVTTPSVIRSLSSSGRVKQDQPGSTAAESTNVRPAKKRSSTPGSGQGTKKDKVAAQKLKDQQRREKDKLRKQKLKDKERAIKQKEKERVAAQKAKLKEKKKAAAATGKSRLPTSKLTPPKAPVNSWGIFVQRYVAQRKEDLAQGEKLPTVTELTKEAAPLYRELAPSERQDLNEEAQRAREAYPAILAAWTASLTPEMIREENKVRLQRRRQGKKGISTLRIKLEGEPKRPASGYMRFNNEVRSKGVDSEVLKGETSITEQSKLVAAAWRALSDDERQAYQDAYLADKARYDEEVKAFNEKLASEPQA